MSRRDGQRTRRRDAALVHNAADPQQVREAARVERDQRREELDDLRAVLATAPGQRLLWRLMAHCKVFETIYDPSARIHYNAGKQDVGHFLMAEINEAAPDALWQMHVTVNQQRERDAEIREAAALRQARDDDDDRE